MKAFAIFIAILAWFSVISQFVVMMDHRVAAVGESIIRFFSFFTILSNLLVALYFTFYTLKIRNGFLKIIDHPVTLTPVTMYILVVGLVYQIALRHIWEPTGLQMIVDEFLHTVIPILVLSYWFLYGKNSLLTYKMIPKWLMYPLIYLVYILTRGAISDHYPYPFVDVGSLGFGKVLANSFLLFCVFIGLSALFVFAGRLLSKK